MSSQESSRISKRKHTDPKEPLQTELDKLMIQYKESSQICKDLQPQIKRTRDVLDELKARYETHLNRSKNNRERIIEICPHITTLKCELDNDSFCSICGEILTKNDEDDENDSDDDDFDVGDY
jgi:predicted  nucleic acid-binding Zn-ribbon protein